MLKGKEQIKNKILKTRYKYTKIDFYPDIYLKLKKLLKNIKNYQ